MTTEQVEGPGSSSLAYNGDCNHASRDSVGLEGLPDATATLERRCPRKVGYWYISLSTGQKCPARCGAHFCGYCGPLNAQITARAISLAEPRRAIRFSLVGDGWQDTRSKMMRLLKQLRRDGLTVELAHHVEPNPRGTGRHSHAWQHGDYIPQEHLQRRCEAVGLGIPYIEAIRQQVGRGASVGYGLKGISYGMKLTESDEQMSTFLECNGGRLVHGTRGFWRDGAERITLGEARKRAVVTEGGDPGPWQLVRFGG